MCSLLNLLVITLWLPASLGSRQGVVQFNAINGLLCIRAEFVQNHSTSSDIDCALLCSGNQRCQAFTLDDGPCQLFEFNKCSKSVRNCSCSRRGQVFVKQQPGLQPGALCPSGYGDDLCGVKYRILYGTGNWSMSRGSCQSESGQMVIMADVVDAIEMEHVDLLFNRSSGSHSLWLGGFQAAGSAEPDGGWKWIECNIDVAPSLWHAGEPGNWGPPPGENVIGRHKTMDKLSDFYEGNPNPTDVLCECVSPFD